MNESRVVETRRERVSLMFSRLAVRLRPCSMIPRAPRLSLTLEESRVEGLGMLLSERDGV